jgi:hypothetical protein
MDIRQITDSERIPVSEELKAKDGEMRKLMPQSAAKLQK